MKEYTLLATLSVFVIIVIDLGILKTRLISKRIFWIFWCIMFALLVIVNGYLTWRPIVIYNSSYFMNIRFFTIPIEDFLFGFSLITLNITIWEYCHRRCRKK